MTDEWVDLSDELSGVLDELTAYYDELEGESPRAAAILAVASMEDELDLLLRSKFPDTTSNTAWKSISGSGPKPFGSLKAKTDVAKVFGFFGAKTQTMIERIATVRNKFAHRTHIREFDHPDVLAVCRELSANPVFPHVYPDNPRAQDIRRNYIDTVKALTARLTEIRLTSKLYIDGTEQPHAPPLPLP